MQWYNSIVSFSTAIKHTDGFLIDWLGNKNVISAEIIGRIASIFILKGWYLMINAIR